MVRWCIRLTRLTLVCEVRMVRWCIRLTRLTLVCEVIRYRLVQVRQNQKKKKKKKKKKSKYYLRDSNGHPSFGGAVFQLHVCYIHSCTTPQAHSINAFSLLPNPLVHTTYASPVSWFSQEYALLATCILSSITQLFFGILFHTHCSRYPIMHNSAEPYLITGKNTHTNLFSTCNTHPLPPPPLH